MGLNFSSVLCRRYVNLCWVMGQFIASGVLRGFLNVESQWAYRGPFAIQWVWPIPIFIGVLMSPESPWWLVRQGRIEDAKRSLRRFTGSAETDADIDRTVAMIVHTNELEKQFKSGTSYMDCLRGVDLRRTEISCIVWLVQAFCGAAIMGYSTYFYLQAGLATERSFDMSMVRCAFGLLPERFFHHCAMTPPVANISLHLRHSPLGPKQNRFNTHLVPLERSAPGL